MKRALRDLCSAFVSLKLTVALIAFSIVLVLAATLDQMNIGAWAVQEKYLHAWAVFWRVGDLSLAIFPGGYTIGGLLLLNLVAAQVFRFQLTWRKSGIYLMHAGLIVLLAGEGLTGLWQDEYQLRLDEGQTKNYAESYRAVELAIIDTTDPTADLVTAIPEAVLAARKSVQHPSLPFRVDVKTYFPNSTLQWSRRDADAGEPAAATSGLGPRLLATAQPVTYKQDERNLPSAFVALTGTKGTIGTWLVSVLLEEPQPFEYAGRTYRIALRFKRHSTPFSLTLLRFSHDRYAGTDIPKNFSSRLRLTTADGRDDREVLIYMNHPLRYGGLTFYQAGFDNNDTTTVLQVVRNPGRLLPYIACAIMTLGFVIQFGLHLVGFVTKRRILTSAEVGACLQAKPNVRTRKSPAGRLLPSNPAEQT